MDPQASKPIGQINWADLVVTEPKEGHIAFEELFGNDHPVVLDVGCARARYTAEVAEQHPDLNFLGVELKRTRIIKGAKRVIRHELSNVRFLEGIADYVFRFVLPDRSISACFIICPDPWPKRRHERRRLFQEKKTTRLLGRILKAEAGLFIKTDMPWYADEIRNVLAADSAYSPMEDWEAFGHVFDRTIKSYYEVLHNAEGRTVEAFAFRFSGNSV